jgi:arsenate reductase
MGAGRDSQSSQALPYFDLVITDCHKAQESCPMFFGAPVRIRWSIGDPAAVEGSYHGKLAAFRRVHDNLRLRIENLLASRVTD